MRPTLTLWLLLTATLACAGFAGAQDGAPAYAPASEAHRPGRWSMQFQLIEDFQFRAFEGASLAMTRNSGPNSAWRFGVDLNGALVSGEISRTLSTDSTSQQLVDPLDVKRYSVQLDLLRLHRFHPARRVGFELGGGPSVSFDRQRETRDASSPVEFESRRSGSRYGLLGKAGVEIMLARALSLHAHYGAFAGYSQQTSTVQFRGNDSSFTGEVQDRLWQVTDEAVTLGVSVYL
jgi:hypothetical protein